MASRPTDQDSNGDFKGKPLQTLRVWYTKPGTDIMTYIWSQSLGDAVWEAIRLEDTRPTEDSRVPNGLPKNSILVDLAVVEEKKDRVISHFVQVTLPLSDVSLVSLVSDSQVRERQLLLRYYAVHTRYMQQYIRRGVEGQLHALVLQWYNDRFNDMVKDEREAVMQD
ncbi:unnamed protein product [Penicillium pancosmium]